jgi:hypothetical protein
MATKLGIVLADFTTSLATELAIAGTTATLQSNVDDDAQTLPDGLIYLTLDGANSSKEHIQAVKTGANLASIYSVSRQGTLTSGAARKHRIGATVTLTDFATIKYLVDLVAGTTDLNSAVPLKYDGTASISDAKHLATKAYVDGVAVAGASNMSTTVKGIAEEATAAEINAGTQAGGTSAELAVNPKYLKDSEYYTLRPTTDEKAALAGTGTPSAANKYCTADYPIPVSYLDNSTDLDGAGASDTKVPTQLAVKTYVDLGDVRTNGVATYDLSTATGSVNIAHGLGRVPKKIKITALWTYNLSTVGSAFGTYNGTTVSGISNSYDGSYPSYVASSTYILYIGVTGGLWSRAIPTFDATNITLAWTRGGSTGIAYLMWEAE